MGIGLHLDEATHAFRFTGTGIVDGITLLDHAGVHANEDQLTDKLVSPKFECKSNGLFIIANAEIFLLFGINSAFDFDGFRFKRRGQIVDHGVHKVLYALVLESGTTGNGNKLVGDRGTTDSLLEVFRRDRFFHEELFTKFFINIGHAGNKIFIGFFGLALEFFGDVDNSVGGTETIVITIHDGFLVDDVDLTAKRVFGTDRNQNGSGIGAELVLNVGKDIGKVGADAVHLVDEANAGNAVLGSLTPDGFSLRLHTGNTAEHDDSTVEHAQGTFHFSCEVNVSGRVNDVDLELLVFENLVNSIIMELLPVGTHSGGRNGDAAFAFLLHPVSRGGTVVRFTNLVNHTRVKQDTFGKGRLAGVNVCGDTDVAVTLQRALAVGAVDIVGHF